MKERLTFVVSWYAFLHVVIILLAVILLSPMGMSLDWVFFQKFMSVCGGAFKALVGDELRNYVILGLSPAIWVGMWFTTGKPRFLPWRG